MGEPTDSMPQFQRYAVQTDNETAESCVQRLFLETLSRVRADIESGEAAVYSVDGYATPDGTGGVSWTINVVFIAGPKREKGEG